MKQLLILLVLVISHTLYAQSNKNQIKLSGNINENISASIADALNLKEPEYDFGKIPQGKPVTHTFEATNNSKEPLKISNVQASCGCTTPEWEKDKIVGPGKGTSIKVGYNAAAVGIFTKTITVTYNDSQTKTITIKGEVWQTPGSSVPENKAIEELKN